MDSAAAPGDYASGHGANVARTAGNSWLFSLSVTKLGKKLSSRLRVLTRWEVNPASWERRRSSSRLTWPDLVGDERDVRRVVHGREQHPVPAQSVEGSCLRRAAQRR